MSRQALLPLHSDITVLSAWSRISWLSRLSFHARLSLGTLWSPFSRGANNDFRRRDVRLAAVSWRSPLPLSAFFTRLSLTSGEANAHVSLGSNGTVVSSKTRRSFGTNVAFLSRTTVSSRQSGRSDLAVVSGFSLFSLASWGSVGGLSPGSGRTWWTRITRWSERSQRADRSRISLCSVAAVETGHSPRAWRSRYARYSVYSGEARHAHFSPFSLRAPGSVAAGFSLLSLVSRQAFGTRMAQHPDRTRWAGLAGRAPRSFLSHASATRAGAAVPLFSVVVVSSPATTLVPAVAPSALVPRRRGVPVELAVPRRIISRRCAIEAQGE